MNEPLKPYLKTVRLETVPEWLMYFVRLVDKGMADSYSIAAKRAVFNVAQADRDLYHALDDADQAILVYTERRLM